MLCADSCFNKTLGGGSGYQVASDKKPHDGKKGRGFAGGGRGPVHTCERTHTKAAVSNTSNMCVRTQLGAQTHREEQVACHRLVTNGIGRPEQVTVIKPTQWLIAKTGHGTKGAMKGRGTDPDITHCSQAAGLRSGVDLALCVWVSKYSTMSALLHVYPSLYRLMYFSDTSATVYVKMQQLTLYLCACCRVINIYSGWRCVQYLCHACLIMHSM